MSNNPWARRRTFGLTSLETYLALVNLADEVVPLAEADRRRLAWPERFLALRHDMDHDPDASLRFARYEAAHGLRASYVVYPTDPAWGPDLDAPSRDLLAVLEAIAGLGHEIVLGNAAVTLALTRGGEPAAVLERSLAALRTAGHVVTAVAAGRHPSCAEVPYRNGEVFTESALPRFGAADRTLHWTDPATGSVHETRLTPRPRASFGLTYDADAVGNTLQLSDSGGRWSHPIEDVAAWFETDGGYLLLTTHPVWWATDGEGHNVREALHGGFSVVRAKPPVGPPTIDRHEGPSIASAVERGSTTSRAVVPALVRTEIRAADARAPRAAATRAPGRLRIVVRGDCCSRRGIALNADLFGGAPQLIRDEKSRADFVLEHPVVGSFSVAELEQILDFESMGGSLAHHARSQVDRATLDVRDADLIVMDNYADMNFAAWREVSTGRKLWIHPKHLRDRPAFLQAFEPLGTLTFEEAADLEEALIRLYRARNGNIPVLYLNQPLAYYARLREQRPEFRALGEELARRLPGIVFPGDVPDARLTPDDMGSCGPGQTLHFAGPSYREMILAAVSRGLVLPSSVAEGVEEAPTAAQAPVSSTRLAPNPGVVAAGGTSRIRIDLSAGHADRAACRTVASRIHDAMMVADPRNAGRARYENGVSILPLAATFDTYWTDADRSSVRRDTRKCERMGYRFALVNRDDYIDDIHEVNTSLEVRQGREMKAAYLEKPRLRPSRDPADECPTHGVLDCAVLSESGKLVAYAWVRLSGELALFTQLLGHGDHLSAQVMKMLFVGALKTLIERGGTKYAMYNLHASGGEGLTFFKEQLGFAAADVDWWLDGQGDVHGPVAPHGAVLAGTTG